MKTTNEICRFVKRHWCASAVGLMLATGQSARASDVHLDVLKTRTDSFTNVTVFNRSRTDIFIKHERGIASIKFGDLDAETLDLLGQSGVAVKSTTSGKSVTTVYARELAPTTSNAGETPAGGDASNVNAQLPDQVMPTLAPLMAMAATRLNPQLIWAVLGGLLIAYLFVCYCLKLICAKAGTEPSILIWLPILQLFPLLRAAGMSGWWFVAWLVPVLNIVAQIVWSFKIVRARGKGVLVAIGLLLPITNLISLLYLAFSSGGGDEGNAPTRKVGLAGAPVLAEA